MCKLLWLDDKTYGDVNELQDYGIIRRENESSVREGSDQLEKRRREKAFGLQPKTKLCKILWTGRAWDCTRC